MKKVLLLVATVMMSVSISFAQTNDKEAAKAAKAAAKALKAEIKAANKVLKEAQGILNVPESGSLSTANDLIQQAMVNVHTKDNPTLLDFIVGSYVQKYRQTAYTARREIVRGD